MAYRGRNCYRGPPSERPNNRRGRERRPSGFGPRRNNVRSARDIDFARINLNERSDEGNQPLQSTGNGGHNRRQRLILASEINEVLSVVDDERIQDYGTSGSKTRVVSNYFKVDSVPHYKIFNFAVEIEPPCESKMVKSKVLKIVSRTNWNNQVFSFTGQSIHLAHKPEILEYSDIQFRNVRYKVKLEATGETVPGTEPFIAILGLILRGRLNEVGFKTIQRNMFDMSSDGRREIEGFQIFPGIKASILPRKGGRLLLCIDRINKIVNKNMVSAIMNRLELGSNYGRKHLIDEVVGSSVMTSYNNRFYRITDVDFNCDSTCRFTADDNRQINFIDYYRERYHLQIHNPRLPLLTARVKDKDGNKKEIHLIPEFCQIAGLDRVSPVERSRMMRVVCRETIPQFRMQYIRNVLQRLTTVDTSRHFPLKISRDPEIVEARYLNEPQPGDPRGCVRFTWRDMGQKSLFRPEPLKRWLILVPEGIRVDNFLSSLNSVMRTLRIFPDEPRVRTYPTRGQNVIAAVQRVLEENDVDRAEMVVILMSNYCSTGFYTTMKGCLSMGYGVPSQFIKEKNFRECKVPIMAKIGIQIGCKTGSEPWSVSGGFGESFRDAMVIGIDCYHSKMTSISAVVCSLNSTFSKCYSRCFTQSPGQELVTCLTMCLAEAINRYKKHNGNRVPTSIVVYRDGIGDGQLGYIGMSECQQILMAMSMVVGSNEDEAPRPKLTYIVVKKRINSRFFTLGSSNKPMANPDGGLVVDRILTMERWRDFYLVPQQVTQGSATPSHFNILADKNKFSMDEVQQFSYKLCHMYFNWSGAIRVPAMCQYAHKLAYMAGTCFKREPHQRLHDLLYYL
ncbi:hypothetical protein ACOME3_007209 [Neoechinorhynchus agilis]